jgi:hypothetical protein
VVVVIGVWEYEFVCLHHRDNGSIIINRQALSSLRWRYSYSTEVDIKLTQFALIRSICKYRPQLKLHI